MSRIGFPKYVVVSAWRLTLTLFLASCSIQSVYVSGELSTPRVELAQEEIDQSLFLIGDAGEPALDSKEPVLATLETEVSQQPRKKTIVFLGDNIYPDGMPGKTHDKRALAEQRLNEQLSVLERSGVTGIFVPGNHDWGEWSDDGVESIRRQEEFISGKGNPNVRMLPKRGSPGPEVVDIGDRLRLVILDTEWWLHGNPKPLYPNAKSEAETKRAIIDSVSNVLRSTSGRYVVVVGHHPLDSHGEHAGFFDWKDYIFPLRNVARWMWVPLPVVGALYPVARMLGVSSQDLSSSAYQELKRSIEQVLSEHPPLIYAGGHEHTLEVLKSSGQYLIVVSGYGTSQHDPSLTKGSNTLFAHRHPGFMRIDILHDKRVRLGVIEPVNNSGEATEVFSMWLTGRY